MVFKQIFDFGIIIYSHVFWDRSGPVKGMVGNLNIFKIFELNNGNSKCEWPTTKTVWITPKVWGWLTLKGMTGSHMFMYIQIERGLLLSIVGAAPYVVNLVNVADK